jgi:hypothetical protein
VTEQPENPPEETGGDVTNSSSDDNLVSQESATTVTSESSSGTSIRRDDQGPGWLPALMAGSVILGIAGFICCGVSTWVLFQKRTELAVRTLEGAYLTELEQSYLEPKTKRAVMDEVEVLIAGMEAGDYENWQSAAIMQRLQRLPVVQWGDLQAIELFINKNEGSDQEEQLREISRLQQAVADGSATSFDFRDVLEPVQSAAPESSSGFSLIQPLSSEQVAEVCLRAKLVADRANIANRTFPKVDLAAIVRREISQGVTTGGF